MDRIGSGLTTRFVQPKGFVTLGPSKAMFGIPTGDTTGAIRVRNAQYERDLRPIEEGCGCPACAGGFSRAYLRHLDRCNEMLGPILGTLHNLWYYQKLMADMRAAIAAGRFADFRRGI